jgi:hypothetical protein
MRTHVVEIAAVSRPLAANNRHVANRAHGCSVAVTTAANKHPTAANKLPAAVTAELLK